MKTLSRYCAVVVAATGLAVVTVVPAIAAKSSGTFVLVPSVRKVSVLIGQSESVRIDVKQPVGKTIALKYAMATRLKKVDVMKSEATSTGVTLRISAKKNAVKQNGFVDLIATGAGQTKRIRIPVFVLPANTVVAGDLRTPVTVAVTTAVPPQTTIAMKPPLENLGNDTKLPPTTTVSASVPSTAPTPAPAAPPTPAPTPAPTAAPTAPPTSTRVGSFLIGANPSSRPFIPKGSTDSVIIRVEPLAGYASAPTFSLGTMPAGTTASFDKLSDRFQTTLRIQTTTATPTGSVPIIINAVDGALSATTTYMMPIVNWGPVTLNSNFPSLVVAGGTFPIHIDASPTPGFDVPPLNYTATVNGAQISLGSYSSSQPSVDANFPMPNISGTFEVDIKAAMPLGPDAHFKVSVTAMDAPGFTFDPVLMLHPKNGATEVSGNFSVPITLQPLPGTAVTWGSVRGVPSGMLSQVSGSGYAWQLNIVASSLKIGPYLLAVNATPQNGLTRTVTVMVNVL
jgi:hypothetical protein